MSDVRIAGEDAPWDAVRIDGDRLVLATTTAAFLRDRNVVSASALVSFLRASPDSFAETFGLTTVEMRNFTARVLVALRRTLPARTLARRRPPVRALGAALRSTT